jgi:hypothetical protein
MTNRQKVAFWMATTLFPVLSVILTAFGRHGLLCFIGLSVLGVLALWVAYVFAYTSWKFTHGHWNGFSLWIDENGGIKQVAERRLIHVLYRVSPFWFAWATSFTILDVMPLF